MVLQYIKLFKQEVQSELCLITVKHELQNESNSCGEPNWREDSRLMYYLLVDRF